MSKESYKGIPFSKKFRGFRGLGYYSSQEYRAFTKQLKKRLDEYFLDDCYFGVTTTIGPNAIVKVTTSKSGNTYEVQPAGGWDRYTDTVMYATIEEYEFYTFVDMLEMLDEDIVYMKEKVSKILNAVKNNQPLDEEEKEVDEQDAFEEIKRRVLWCGD